MDPFDTLGVTQDMSQDEIKKIYRQKIRENHPDVSSDPAAGQRTVELNAAFSQLKARNASPRPKSSTGNQGAYQPWTHQNFDDAAQRDDRTWRRSEHSKTQSTASESHRAKPDTGADEQAQRARAERVFWAAQKKMEREAQERSARQQRAADPFDHGVEDVHSSTGVSGEVKIADSHRSAMQQALEQRKQQEAHKRYLNNTGTYADPRRKLGTDRGDMPAFHAVDRMSFDGQSVRLDLTQDAKAGRNIIAMPKVTRVGDCSLKPEAEVELFEVVADKSGKVHASHLAGSGLKVDIHFGRARERERARDHGRQV